MLDQFAQARRELVNERLGHWTDAERTVLLDLLKRLSGALAGL
jgi:hypothetical protein